MRVLSVCLYIPLKPPNWRKAMPDMPEIIPWCIDSMRKLVLFRCTFKEKLQKTAHCTPPSFQ